MNSNGLEGTNSEIHDISFRKNRNRNATIVLLSKSIFTSQNKEMKRVTHRSKGCTITRIIQMIETYSFALNNWNARALF